MIKAISAQTNLLALNAASEEGARDASALSELSQGMQALSRRLSTLGV